MSTPGELVMRCFHARTEAHVFHLQTRSYAAHVALQGFYDGIVPLIDSFAEAYQGEYGLIEGYPPRYVQSEDALTALNTLSAWIEKNRFEVCDDSDTYLQNIVDEIVALIRSTQYKLRILK